MIYGRPKILPTRSESKVNTVDDNAARVGRDYIRSIMLEDSSETVPGWIMVIAESYPAAIRAAELVKVDWTPGLGVNTFEKNIRDHAVQQIARTDGRVLLNTGGGDTTAAFKAANETLKRTYASTAILHFLLEPVNALAFERMAFSRSIPQRRRRRPGDRCSGRVPSKGRKAATPTTRIVTNARRMRLNTESSLRLCSSP